MTTKTRDVWELTEDPPKGCADTASLWHWSTNYDSGKGPMTLFLDLIGWSEKNIGEPIYSLKDAFLGWVELDKLADALKEYANDPSRVQAFVDQLLEAEGR
jgi:hypothetical protein